jgi:hypothetical protein
VKLNKSATETVASLMEVYGDATHSRNMVFKWHRAFRECRENVEADPRSGRSVSSTNDQNVEVVRAVKAKDRRLSVRMNAEETGLDKNAVHRILTDHLHMRKIYAKLVPKNLSVEQKANRLKICQDLLGSLEIEVFFYEVMTGAEQWVFDYDPKTKRQSAEWHTKSSPPSEESSNEHIVFFHSRGIVHKEFVPPGQTVNHAFYKMSWNDFENGSSEPERTLQTTGCCTTITHQFTLRLQFVRNVSQAHKLTNKCTHPFILNNEHFIPYAYIM